MASKISGLTAVTALDNDDLMEVVEDGASRKATVAQVVAAALNASGPQYIGDTANANNTAGLTVNQADADNHLFTGKSSDVNHNLTSGALPQETDDFVIIRKVTGTGGCAIQVTRQDEVGGNVLQILAYGGTAETGDTTSTTGLITIIAAEHDGANATIAAPTNQNIFAIRAATGAAAYATRLILKGDDGELHLGNTTLQALDDEDDARLVRAMQKESSSAGIVLTEYDNPFDNYDWLKSKGLVGEKDERGEFLFPLQSRLHAHEGAIWQGYVRQRNLEKQLEEKNDRIAALEARLARLEMK